MARTAKIQADPRKENPLPDLSAASPKTNEPTRDDALFMMGQFAIAQAKLKEAQNSRKRIRQRAKNMGFDLEQFDLAIAERERQDGTTLDNLRTFQRYCQFFDLPIGSQFELFDKPNNGGGASQQSANEKAYREGYELGVMAKDPDEQAYPPMTPEGQEHMRGWHDGQKVNTDKLAKQSEEFAAEEAAKKQKALGKKIKDQVAADDAGEAETKH